MMGVIGVFGAILLDFSSDGFYMITLTATNKRVLGVLWVNGAPLPLVKIVFFAIFRKFSATFECRDK